MNQALVNIAVGSSGEAMVAWEQICGAFEKYRKVFVFADFDGTLSEFADIPSAATIDPDAKTALTRLSTEKAVVLAVLSGRSITDVADRVGLPIIYGGDHGLEMHASDFEFAVPTAELTRLRMPTLCNQIRQAIQHIPGAFVEAKRLTASVHYRQVASEHVPALRDLVSQCLDPAQYELRNGHLVLEVRPRVEWNKGDAVQWILERHGASAEQAICIGDDETDEDMFIRVPRAVNVRVLNGAAPRTAATYCVNREEVPEFLHGIVDVIHGMT